MERRVRRGIDGEPAGERAAAAAAAVTPVLEKELGTPGRIKGKGKEWMGGCEYRMKGYYDESSTENK